MRPHKAFGADFEESEIINSNNQFYAYGSSVFRSLYSSGILKLIDFCIIVHSKKHNEE